MRYIINNNINFRTSDGALWLEDDEDSAITLTITTNRLLVFMLERQGKVLMRDEILSRIWDAHGLKSSNNSLNKYISDLRNIFKNRGIEADFIVTVPRIGFMLSNEIRVENDSEQGVPVPYTESVQASLIENSDVENVETSSLPAIKRPYRLYLVLLAAVLAVGSLIAFNNPFSTANKISMPQRQNTYPLGVVDGCQATSFTPSTPEAAQLKLSIIRSILDTEKLSCPADGTLFFESSDPVLYGGVGRVFLSICRSNQSKENRYSSCYNFYEVSHAVQGK